MGSPLPPCEMVTGGLSKMTWLRFKGIAMQRTCGRCGVGFPPSTRRNASAWCSEACRVAAYYAAKPKPIISKVYFRSCQECAVPFCAQRGATRYCSLDCRRVFLNRKRIADGTTRKYAETRRVRKLGIDSERVERLVVAERGAWKCGICFDDINPSLTYPDPESFSVDHIQPLSLGGAHSYANTRPAHLECNVKRGNRVAA